MALYLTKKQVKLAAETNQTKKKKLLKEIEELTEEIAKRNVTVYGAINLRTDGRKIVMAQKLERDRKIGGSLTKWDVYKLEPDADGVMTFEQGGTH